MKPLYITIALLWCTALVALVVFLMQGHSALLTPQGLVAHQELTLITNVIILMLITAVPVLLLTVFFAWWYREGNTKAVYLPNWEHGFLNELVWWAVPIEIVLVLGAVTWSSTHALDAHKPLAISGAPITVEVVALDWKWLFIYPEQHIATVNYVHFPANRPVRFLITADAPMNSFWIPELSGQIYAMTGMSTELTLAADHAGVFAGRSANYSGKGFATMSFTAEADSPTDFDAWVAEMQAGPKTLSLETYQTLREPSEAATPVSYASVIPDLYSIILMKFMGSTSMPMHTL